LSSTRGPVSSTRGPVLRGAAFRIEVDKAARTLRLFEGARLERSFPVALGRNASADKAVEGDEATPEGEFYVCAKNPRSKFFLSLCLSYPDVEDAQRGLAAGLITLEEHAAIVQAQREKRLPPQHTRLGGEIYIHGQPAQFESGRAKDWTRGCIALENPAMREVYERAELGTPVLIVQK
jgi:murein L,D-transpeptidase YafK